MIASIVKFGRLKRRDRRLVLDATLTLAAAAAAVALLPFRRVAKWSERSVADTSADPVLRADTIRRVRWAILACASQVPWRALCLEQSLAAQSMLRRRGIATRLYLGAAPDQGAAGMTAHAWLKDGNVDIIGGEIAAQFAVLATFPRDPADSRMTP